MIAVRAARHPHGVGAAAPGAGLAGFAVMALADHPANTARLSVALWVVVGLLVAAASPGAAGSTGGAGGTATTVPPTTTPPASTALRPSS